MAFLGALGMSTAVVLVAEMGDKTQLVAMSLASRYRIRTVLLGITAATVVVHGISVLLAEILGMALPHDWLSLIAGLAFLGFGVWTSAATNSPTLTKHARPRGPPVPCSSPWP